MRCEAGRRNKTSTPYGIFIVTITRRVAFSPHEVRLTPLDTNPVFLCLGDSNIWNTTTTYEIHYVSGTTTYEILQQHMKYTLSRVKIKENH